MKLAIVGSRVLSPRQSRLVEMLIMAWLYFDKRVIEVVSGGASGVDSIAAETARMLQYRTTEILPRSHDWESGYKPRNTEIASCCDELLCIRSRESLTYGSGWTADLAETLGKRVYRYYV